MWILEKEDTRATKTTVMAALSRTAVRFGLVMPALVAGIHVFKELQ